MFNNADGERTRRGTKGCCLELSSSDVLEVMRVLETLSESSFQCVTNRALLRVHMAHLADAASRPRKLTGSARKLRGVGTSCRFPPVISKSLESRE